MGPPAALQLFAGRRARRRLREQGLKAADVKAIPAAAGGPKGLVLNPLDRFLFGHWLRDAGHVIHLLGASIGAWRVATAALDDPDRELQRMAEDYVHQRYEHEPGKAPRPAHVSEVFGATLRSRFDGRAGELLRHPCYRVHIFTSHGRGLLAREGRWRTPAGYLGAFVSNLAQRRWLSGWLRRVVFSDLRDPLPFDTSDFATQRVALSADNLAPAILASCSIPFWLRAVHDIPGGPAGAYWDGGITDYHLHLDFRVADGVVLYPHFQPRLVPGWLDKPLKRRHAASRFLDDVVVLAPHPDWVRQLPGGKLPDRGDFKAFGDDVDARVRVWSRAIAESERLADEFDAMTRRDALDALPLP